MPAAKTEIAIDGQTPLSGILLKPRKPTACFVFAHGAGADMHHVFMERIATSLHDRGIATLRYQFPFMEKKSRRPDPPPIARTAVRAAVAEASKWCPGLPLIAGGKSFGGRMTSQAHAMDPLVGVRGLVFLGFPLHPAGIPSPARGDHLSEVELPMLFIQGTRDKLADVSLLIPVVTALGKRATLDLIDEADHAFHVPARTGRTDDDVLSGIADAIATWTAQKMLG